MFRPTFLFLAPPFLAPLVLAPLVLAPLVLAPTVNPAAAQPNPPPTHHPQHHRARHRRLARLTPAPGIAPQASRQIGDGLPGSPAPVPDENAGPPGQAQSGDAHFVPGNLSIHYPPIGEGYTRGSSPQAIDDRTTQKVPGMTAVVPLRQGTTEALPDPGK